MSRFTNAITDKEIRDKYYAMFNLFKCIDNKLDILATASAASQVDFDTAYELYIPAGKLLDKIVITVDSDQVIDVGDTNGSSEYMSSTVYAGTPFVLDIALYSELGQTIWITGGTGIHVKYYIL